MSIKRLQKFVSIFSALFLLIYSFTPYLSLSSVRAQSADPTPTTEITPPQDNTPTPVPEVSPTIAPSPTDTPAPTDTVQPTPTGDQLTPSPTDTPVPSETGPPPQNNDNGSGSNNDSTSVTPPPTPTVSVSPTETPTPDEHGDLSVTLLPNTKADSLNLNLDAQDVATSASLVTDKADYAPTDTVFVTGLKFNPGETYSLTISSSDSPAVSFETKVTADASGGFLYAYQLDGNYRPNYKVEAKDASGNIVATATFTDSPASGCTNDSAGANDVPGQKDLTKMCADYSGLPTNIGTSWNWDDTSFPGSNTGDACSLFDSNGNGKADYALCVEIGGNPATYQAKFLYSCNDSSAQRCFGSVSLSPDAGTTCVASVQAGTNPFDAGSDTVASCTTKLTDVGGSSTTLLDVCSYPSASPNSDPSDCILFRTNAGKLTVTKVLSPSNDPGLFNLQVDGTTQASNVTNGGTTLTQDLSAGSHTVGETAGTATDLSNYTSSVVCKDGHGTGNTVSTTGTNPWTLSVTDGTDILCTITNTRINNGSITIIKDAQPNDPQDFTFTTTGSGLSSFSLDDDSDPTLSNTKVFSNLAAGTYSVSEGAVTDWTQTSATCSDGSPVSAISLQAGENVTCTFTNTKQAKLTVHKVVTNHGGNKTSADFAPYKVDSTTVPLDTPTVFSIGSHTVTEATNSSYTATFSGGCDTSGVVTLAAGDNKTCTITNEEKPAKLIVTKVVVKDNGGTKVVSDFPLFVDQTGVTSGTTNTFDSGSHVVSETNQTGYEGTISGDCDANGNVTLVPGQTKSCTITNDDIQPKLTVTKVVSGGTAQVSDFPLFVGQTSVTSGVQNGFNAGAYTVSETNQTGYTGGISGDCASNGSITLNLADVKACTITNTRDTGSIDFLKVVSGGSAVASDWTFTISGGNGIAKSGDTKTYPTGSYTVTESGPADYTLTNATGVCSLNSNVVTLDVTAQGGTCTITNTRNTGELLVHKLVDTKGNGIYDVTDDTDANTLGFRWGFDATPANNTNEFGTPATTLDTGDYNVYENSVSNYHFVGWFEGEGSCTDNELNQSLPANVSVSSDQPTDITLCNARDTGTITVNKVIEPSQDSGLFDLQVDEVTKATDQRDEGTTNAVTVITGNHSVGEVAGTDTSLSDYVSSISCDDNNNSFGNGTSLSGIQVNSDDEITCTITNTRKGKVIVTKYNDVNGNGKLDEGEGVLSGWTISLGQSSEDTLSDGTATFDNVLPDNYTLGEVVQNGWEQTNIICGRKEGYDSNNKTFDLIVNPGDIIKCSVLNHNQTPVLTISKANDASGNKAPGDSVGFTITISNDPDAGEADNVKVVDLLPKGFHYNGGSWHAVLNGVTNLSVPEPTYASPGTWTLPNMNGGDTITLTYSVTIDSGQQAGTYFDNALGQGTPIGDSSNILLASAVTPGTIGDPNFVGTEVKVVTNANTATKVSLNTKREETTTGGGEVLGASTGLPATGENTLWVIIATLMFTLGAGSVITGFKLKKKYE